jgi:TP901 family phage tail tape measure protein
MDRHKVIVEYAATIQPYASAARTLRAEIESLNASIVKSRAVSSAALQGVTADFNASLKGMRNWSTESIQMDTNAARLGKSIERNQLTLAKQKDLLKEYRAGAVGARGAISELAKEQVRMSRSVVNFQQDANGRRTAQVSTPGGINFKSQATQIAVARQEMQIYNRVLMQNAEATVNWGKNTQWAGRQIMVGMTVPLLMMGAAAKNIFLDVDKELTRMAKVYGGAVGIISDATLENVKKQVTVLGTDIASEWGVSMKETVGLAADVAATGKEGEDLLVSTREAMRLSVLGEVDRQEALKATLSLQSAFKLSNQELVESVNLLNAVENQTSTSLEDLSLAIPKAGPVVKALGGDVGDLATMLVAMKEGGIQAGEGANAIKSGLASMINPTKRAREAAEGLGVDLGGIVERNKGELMPTLIEFREELMKLSSFERAQLIEKIFGKYQFARISALFENLGREGSQSIQAMELAGASAATLGAMADKEMSRLTDSASGRWKRAVEGFKAQMIPVGEAITKVFTTVLNAVNKVLEVFNNLPGPVKTVLGTIAGIAALVGPLLMVAGIFGNFIGQVMKGLAFLRGKKYGVFDMLTADMVAANAATNQLVDAQFNEKASLLEINGVMEQQIAILNELAAAHTRTAQATNNAAQTMTPPPAPAAGRRTEGMEYPAAQQYGKREVKRGGEVRSKSGDYGRDAASSYAMQDEAFSRKVVASTKATTVTGSALRVLSPADASAANDVGEAIAQITAREVASGVDIDPDIVHAELQKRFATGTPEQKQMAKEAAAGLYGFLEVDPKDPEIKKILDSVPELHRDHAGAAARTIAQGLPAAGVKGPKVQGSYQYSHFVPHAERNSGQDAMTNPFQMWDPTELNTTEGASRMTSQQVSSGLANSGALTVGTWAGIIRAAQKDAPGTAAGSLLEATGRGKSNPAGAVVKGLTGNELKVWERWTAVTQQGTVNLQGLADSLQKIGEDAFLASEAIAQANNLDAEAATKRLDAAKKAEQSAKAAVYSETKVAEQRSKATRQAIASASELQRYTTKPVAAAIAAGVRQGGLDGMNAARSAITQRMTTIEGMSRTTSAQQAEYEKLRVAAAKFDQAAQKIAAAEASAAKAAATGQISAQEQLAAAKIELTAAQEQMAAANRQIAAANEEIGAAAMEMQAAQTELQAAQTRAGGAGNGVTGGAVDLGGQDAKPKGKMAKFAGSVGGGTMMVGGAAMGVGMLTGNEFANKFGMAAMALGMIAQPAEMAAGALKGLSGKFNLGAGRIGVAASAARTGLMSMAGPLLAGGPVTLALGGLAAAATLAYLAWKKQKEKMEAWERGAESNADITGVQKGDRNRLRDPGENAAGITATEDAKLRTEMSENAGFKAIGDDIDKQGNSATRKVMLLERSFTANLREIRNNYEGERLKAEEDRIKKIYQLLAEEKGLAKEWVDAQKGTKESAAKTAVSEWQRLQKEEAAPGFDKNAGAGTGWTPEVNWDTGQVNMILNIQKTAANARVELQGMQEDLAIGFKDAALTAEDFPDLINNILPVADEWRQISLAGAGDFQSMRDKMQEGLPDFLHKSIEDANTMDQAILNMIDRLNLVPREVTIAMNLVQGTGETLDVDDKGNVVRTKVDPNETKEQFEARKVKEYTDNINNLNAAKQLQSSLNSKILESESKTFDSEAAGAAYDRRIEGIEAADKAAERAHKREQDRRKDQQDAIKEQIDGKRKTIEAHQKVIEKINDETAAQKKALDKAKDIADFNRDAQKSQINYYDAIARGDFVGAANIRLEQEQASADQQYEQAGQTIDDKGEAKVKKEEAKIEGVNKEIEALEARIDAIQKAGELSDRAYEKEKERRQDALEAIRKNKDAHVKAAEAKFRADQAAEAAARKAANDTFNTEMDNINKLASSNKIGMEGIQKRTKAAYDGIAKYMGWDNKASAAQAAIMANTLIAAHQNALKGIGLDPTGGDRKIGKMSPDGKYMIFPGGRIPAYSHSGEYIKGGPDAGKNGLKRDETMRTLQAGEYVIRKEAVNKFGVDTFHSMNKMLPPKMHTGGPVKHAHGAGRVGAASQQVGLKSMQAAAWAKIEDLWKTDITPGAITTALAGNVGPGNTANSGAGVKWGGVDTTGASPTAKAAMGRAMADFTNLVGMCLQEVRGWYGIGSKYGSASLAWQGATKKHRDANPKLGAPVFWTGGSQGYGHIAMYMGKGLVRSTDRPTGRISNQPMSSFGGKLQYAGWTEDLNGKAISLRKGAEIQKDNVLANLHARETVLTSDLSSSLRRGINGLSDVPAIIGRGGSGGSVFNEGERTFNITVNATPGMDVDDLADAMASAAQRAEARVGG